MSINTVTTHVTTPITIDFTTHELGWFSCLARIVRLGIFKIGILPFATCYERFILDRWQNLFSGYGYCGCSGNYDVTRAQRMTEALLDLGGEESRVVPRDGEANLQVIKLTASALKSKIEALGGVWEKSETQIIIKPPHELTSEWNTFYRNSLKKIFPNETVIEGKSCLITSPEAELIPFNGTEKTKCVLFSRLGKSYVMNKSEIGYFLGKGIDVSVYDTRGVLNSVGYPSEAGLYNDIDAVADNIMESYKPSEVCIYGSCGESFAAMHLFKRFQSSGINMILENIPASLDRAMIRISWFAAWIFSFFSEFLKAPKIPAFLTTPEDGFNSISKLESLPDSEENADYGYVVLAKTEGDSISPPEEVEEIAELIRKKGNRVHVLSNRAEETSVICMVENLKDLQLLRVKRSHVKQPSGMGHIPKKHSLCIKRQ